MASALVAMQTFVLTASWKKRATVAAAVVVLLRKFLKRSKSQLGYVSQSNALPCAMQLPSAVKKVAIVGTGTIGSGWAALFCAKGYTVVAFVRSPASERKFLGTLEVAWRKLVERGLAADPEGYKLVTCVFNLAECVSDADYVQESVVEDLPLKQSIIHEIDNFAPPHVIVGSSTSFIPLSLLRVLAKKHPERIATAHPTLPQWDAFCEVLGSSDAITQWLAKLYGKGGDIGEQITGLGMDVVPMKKEWHGHAFNSLLQSVILTSTVLVHSGVCDAHEVDLALVHLGRITVASGGLSGALVGVIGGGSVKAARELTSDIVMGVPVAWGAILIDRVLPSFLAGPALGILQVASWPIKFFKLIVARCVSWWFRPFHLLFDESPSGSATFEATTLKSICALEKHAAIACI
jgi:3-hydroxyacyl-CoA dehydrogenase